MLPVSGAEQLNTSGAIGERPMISHSGAYSRLVSPAPSSDSGRNRFHSPRQLLEQVRRLLALGEARAPCAAGCQHHIEPTEIGNRKWAQREAEFHQHLVDLRRRRAFLQHEQRLARAPRQQAIGHEALARPHQHRDLAEALAERHEGRDHLRGGAGVAHVLNEPHEVGRIKEVHARDICGPRGDAGQLIQVEERGVAHQNGPGPAHPIEPGEDRLLQGEVFGHRLDHEVGLMQLLVCVRFSDQSRAPCRLILRQAPAPHLCSVAACDGRQGFPGAAACVPDQGDRNAGIGKAHRDAAAHHSAADHRRPAHLALGGLRREAGNPRYLALGGERMALCPGLRSVQQGDAHLVLAPQRVLERKLVRHAHRLHRLERGDESALLAREHRAELIEHLRLIEPCGQLARTPHGAPLAQHPLSEGSRRELKIRALHQLIQQSLAQRLGGAKLAALGNHAEREACADQPRQTLCAAGAGNDSELHLRKPEARFGHRDAKVTGECDLETAAERGPMDSGDDRLRTSLDAGDEFAKERWLHRPAELAHVRAGAEGAPPAHDQQRAGARVRGTTLERLGETCAHGMRKRVDRRMIDHGDADASVLRIRDRVGHGRLASQAVTRTTLPFA
jgi:hypothetical protein